MAVKEPVMKRLLMTVAVLAIASSASAQENIKKSAPGLGEYCGLNNERCDPSYAEDNNWGGRPSRVIVTPPLPQGPPPLGWIYGPYTMCGNPPRCSMGVVNVQAHGLNVRVVPNGQPTMALVNGTPLIPLQQQGEWLLVAAGCDLTLTFAWSWTAGVPLNRCWVYF
jgi:hypothetical protein